MNLNVVNTITGIVCALGSLLVIFELIAKIIRNACSNKRPK